MATVPIQITWVAGQVVTAAQMNANVRDAVNFLLNPPSSSARQTVGQVLTTAVTTAITLDAEDRDNDGMHSTVSNTSRLTAQTPGWYIGSGGVCFGGNATGGRTLFYRVNGSTANVGGNNTAVTLSTASARLVGPTFLFFLNVADFLEVAGNQASGGNLTNDTAVGAQSYLMATWNGST